MGVYKVSAKARNDIAILYEYGIIHFGLNQAQDYVLGMEEYFKKLANNIFLGGDSSQYSKNLFKLAYKSHVIYYKHLNNGVIIVRVLSQRANQEQYF